MDVVRTFQSGGPRSFVETCNDAGEARDLVAFFALFFKIVSLLSSKYWQHEDHFAANWDNGGCIYLNLLRLVADQMSDDKGETAHELQVKLLRAGKHKPICGTLSEKMIRVYANLLVDNGFAIVTESKPELKWRRIDHIQLISKETIHPPNKPVTFQLSTHRSLGLQNTEFEHALGIQTNTWHRIINRVIAENEDAAGAAEFMEAALAGVMPCWLQDTLQWYATDEEGWQDRETWPLLLRGV